MGRPEIYEKAKTIRALIFNEIKDKPQITIAELRILLPELNELSDILLTKYLYQVMSHYPIEIVRLTKPRGKKTTYFLNNYGVKK